MARTNLSVLPDVSGCLRDAMDTMFNSGNQREVNKTGHTIITPDDNDLLIDVVNDDGDQSSAEALQASNYKRKLANTTTGNHGDQNENGGDSTKRLCTTNGHH